MYAIENRTLEAKILNFEIFDIMNSRYSEHFSISSRGSLYGEFSLLPHLHNKQRKDAPAPDHYGNILPDLHNDPIVYRTIVYW